MSLNENTDTPRRALSNATQLLLMLWKRYPEQSKEEIIEKFGERVADDVDIAGECARDWASLNWKRITGTGKPKPQPKSDDDRKISEEAEAAAEAAIKEKIVEVFLLDMVIDGKKLRDMTGTECKRKGGWLTAIGQKVKARQKVGQVLSEAELKGLYK